MSQYNLDRIFQPRRVAVVGASEKTGSIGNALMKNLIDGGYKGMLLPVNPKYDAVHGLTAVQSVSALETGVDLVVIATPIVTVPDIVRQCVEKKVAGGVRLDLRSDADVRAAFAGIVESARSYKPDARI